MASTGLVAPVSKTKRGRRPRLTSFASAELAAHEMGCALFAIGEEGTERALLQGDVRSGYPTRTGKE
jgi:hypothetical protein